MVDDSKVTEGSEVLLSGLRRGAHKTDRARDYARNEQGIVERHWATFFEWIDLDVTFCDRVAIVVCTTSVSPLRVWRCGHRNVFSGFPFTCNHRRRRDLAVVDRNGHLVGLSAHVSSCEAASGSAVRGQQKGSVFDACYKSSSGDQSELTVTDSNPLGTPIEACAEKIWCGNG